MLGLLLCSVRTASAECAWVLWMKQDFLVEAHAIAMARTLIGELLEPPRGIRRVSGSDLLTAFALIDISGVASGVVGRNTWRDPHTARSSTATP